MNASTASFIFVALLAATPVATPAATPARGSQSATEKQTDKQTQALPAPIQSLYQAGEYRQAADALQAEVARNPNDAALYFWLGRSLFEVRDFSKSISAFEKAVNLEPKDSEYHDWLGRACGRRAEEIKGRALEQLGLAKRTHNEFQTAVQLDDANLQAQRDLIAFMTSAPGDLGGGEEHVQEQIKALAAVDPTGATLAQAGFDAAKKKFDLADEQYEKALASSPKRIADLFEIANYDRDRGDAEHLEQAVEVAAKIAPSDPRLSYYRGVSLVLQKSDPESAERDLRAYLQAVPDNSEVPSHSSADEWLGKLYENEGKPDLAAARYRAAQALDPQNKDLRDDLKRTKN